MVEKEVFSSTDEFIVSRICTVFKEKDIPFVRKDGGAVDYLSIKYGQDLLSQKKIFVSQEDYEKARELLEFLDIDEKEEVHSEIKALKVIPIEDEFGYGKYHTLKVILGIIIGTTISLLLIFFIIQIIVFVLRR